MYHCIDNIIISTSFSSECFGLVCFNPFFPSLSSMSSYLSPFPNYPIHFLLLIFPFLLHLSHLFSSLLCPKINFLAIFVVVLLFFAFFSGTQIGGNKAAGFAPPTLQPLDQDESVGSGSFVIWSHLRFLLTTLSLF